MCTKVMMFVSWSWNWLKDRHEQQQRKLYERMSPNTFNIAGKLPLSFNPWSIRVLQVTHIYLLYYILALLSSCISSWWQSNIKIYATPNIEYIASNKKQTRKSRLLINMYTAHKGFKAHDLDAGTSALQRVHTASLAFTWMASPPLSPGWQCMRKAAIVCTSRTAPCWRMLGTAPPPPLYSNGLRQTRLTQRPESWHTWNLWPSIAMTWRRRSGRDASRIRPTRQSRACTQHTQVYLNKTIVLLSKISFWSLACIIMLLL